MSYDSMFLAGIEMGMAKDASAADQLARELLEGGLSGVRQASTSGNPGLITKFLRGVTYPVRAPYKGIKDIINRRGTVTDEVLGKTQDVLGRTQNQGLRGEIELARQNIINEANKRIASNAAIGAGVGGVSGAAMADEGEGAQGFLRGAALGGLGGAALGGRQASKIRKNLADEMGAVGLYGKPTSKQMGDFFSMADLNTMRGGVRYNPLQSAARQRVQQAQQLRSNLANMADDVANQSFKPAGAAALGAAGGIGGTVGYNVGERYMNRHLGGNNQGNQPRGGPPMPMRPPMPPPMPPPRPMPPPMYGYYPYGGR